MEKLFPTKLDCVTKMNQVIDADLRYSRFPGLILYMVSHGLSMLEQKCFGRPLRNSQGKLSVLRCCVILVLTIIFTVHFEVPSLRRDKSSASSYSKSSRRSRSSSRSSSSSRSGSSSRSRSFSRSPSPRHHNLAKDVASPSPHRRVHDGSQHALPTTDQSPKRSMSPNKHQSTTNQSPNTVTGEERANRFDRALLREKVDGNSPRK